MNAEGLLAHYARIAAGPDAIAKLKRFVLDLAVRGKLVEQDVGEESASQLLVKINQAKERRIASGDIRKPRELVNDDKVDQPFSVPATWKWVRLDEVGAIVGGGTPSASDPENFAEPGQGVPWLTPADLGGFKGLYVLTGSRDLSEKGVERSSATVMPQGTVLFTSRAPIGYVAIAANPLATNQGFKSVVPYVDECSRFIALILKTFAPEIDAKAPGTTFKEVSGKIVSGIPFPLAPLAEQQRIVGKVDELMALCDQLEAARAQREITRDRLAAASLARLNTPDPDTFPADARFALDALPVLTTRPDQIKQFRQTILNLAVRGKLVHHRKTGDFFELEAITRVLGKRLRRGVPDAVKVPREVSDWQLPSAWRSMSAAEMLMTGILDDLKDGNHGANHPKVSDFSEEGLPFITAAQVSDHELDFTNAYKISGRPLERLRVGFAKSGDVIYTHKGTVGRVGVANRDCILSPQTTYYRPNSSVLLSRYLMWFLSSDLFANQVDKVKKQTTRDFVSISKQYEFFHAIPPLAEQHCIVTKVDELMALCDQLEASLTTGETTRSRLLDALLHEALVPDPTVSIEHRRAAVSGYVISRLASRRNFGRTAHMKHLYLAESRLGLNLGGRYVREAAGPLDTGIYELEKQAEAADWYTHSVETLPSGNEKVSYKPGKALKALAKEGVAVLGPSREEMDRLIDLMGGLKTEQVEIIATLFAAWNDALLDGQDPEDDSIVREVREHWHVSKQRFAPADLLKWLEWMRQHDVAPLGHPPRTMQQTAMEF